MNKWERVVEKVKYHKHPNLGTRREVYKTSAASVYTARPEAKHSRHRKNRGATRQQISREDYDFGGLAKDSDIRQCE